MLNRAAVASWIKPQHLEDPMLQSYCDSFNAHPARMVVLSDFLNDDVAERLSAFLTTEAEFQSEYGLYSVEDEPVNETQWLQAPEDDRFFRYAKLVGTAPQFTLSPNALTYLQFRQAFQTDDFKAFFEAISGLELASSDDFGAHFMQAGDFLRPHSDDNRDRRLALVIYLSPGWESSMGGALNVVDPNGAATTVEAEYNSLVAFDVLADTLHFVAPISADTNGMARVTIGGWYHRPGHS